MENNKGNNKTINGFIISRCNKGAAEACNKLIENPIKNGSIIFVFGKSPCGKTNLLHYVATLYCKKYNEEARVVSFQNMIDDIVCYIKEKNYETFFKKYSCNKLLLIDDAQCIMGFDAVQEEFVRIFKQLTINGVNIIMTSEYGLNQYKVFKKQLTKEKNFTICKINEADFSLRKKILRNALAVENLFVTKRVFYYLVSNKKIKISSFKGCVLNIKLLKKIDEKIADEDIINSLKKYEKVVLRTLAFRRRILRR